MLDSFRKHCIFFKEIGEARRDTVSVTTISECHHKVPGKVGDCEIFTVLPKCHVTEKGIQFMALAQNQLVNLPKRIMAVSSLFATGMAKRKNI